MTSINLDAYLEFLPAVSETPRKNMWLQYDEEADVLYVNFTQPSEADDSELTDDDVIVRYQDDQIIGYTILHVSKRRPS